MADTPQDPDPIDAQLVALDRAADGMTYDRDVMQAAWRTLITLESLRDQAIYPMPILAGGRNEPAGASRAGSPAQGPHDR